ncbi:MAG: hypothetical protein LBG14_04400 [Treponema sp.]|jgi:hypothetical protein|nr:hypothetical protein [Treponema sp.]
MTRISVPGSERGFALLDALICLFTTALILLLLSCAVSGTLRSSFRVIHAGAAIIEERNSGAALLIEGAEDDER